MKKFVLTTVSKFGLQLLLLVVTLLLIAPDAFACGCRQKQSRKGSCCSSCSQTVAPAVAPVAAPAPKAVPAPVTAPTPVPAPKAVEAPKTTAPQTAGTVVNIYNSPRPTLLPRGVILRQGCSGCGCQ